MNILPKVETPYIMAYANRLLARMHHVLHATKALPWLAFAASPPSLSLDTLRQFIPTLPGVAFLLDEEARLIAWSPATAELLQTPPETLAAAPVFAFFAPRCHENVQRALQRARQEGAIQAVVEIFPEGAETSRFLRLHLKRYALREGNYFVGTAHDATAEHFAREWHTRSTALYEALDAFVQAIENGARNAADLEPALAPIVTHLGAEGAVLFTPTAVVTVNIPARMAEQLHPQRTHLFTLADICTDTRLRAEHADLAATLDALVNTTQQRYVILPLSIHDVKSALILFYAAEKRFTSAEQAAWHATRRVLRRAVQVSIILDTAARQLRDLTILYQVHSLAQEHASPESLARHLIPTLTALLGAHHVRFYLYTNQKCTCQANATTECNLPETAFSFIENQIAGGRTRILQGDELDPLRQFCSSESCSMLVLQPLSNNHPVGFLWVEFTHPQPWTPNDQLLFSTLGRTIGGTIANLHLLRQTESRLRVLESVHHVSRALREAQSAEELLEYLLEHVLQTLHINTGSIWLYNEEDDQMYPIAARGWLEAFSQSPVSAHGTIGGLVLAHKQTIVAEEFRTDPRTNPNLRDRVPPNWGGLCIPLRHDEHVEGVMYLAVPNERRLTEEEILIAETLAEIGATALNRMRLHQETQQRVRQLEALRTIDRAITGSMDLHLILKVILDHLIQYTQADAALVSLYNANANLLEFGVGQGFYSYGIRTLTPHLSEGLALKALHQHRMLFVKTLAEDETFTRTSQVLLENEHLVSGYFVPLYAKGDPKGVLELYFRRSTTLPSDTLEFIETVAQQAAIAIETAQLFEDLQRSNVELSLAYDATIEGWARALELRDEETKGHSQRVTEMTLLLARAMGIQGEDLVHIRRGALLHDIGKMGIPDSILLKPGPLTDEEWEIMRQHPVLAYKLLSPIPFLRPALDIPYCHHEKWDGTGYPRGLKGEEIPLAARIFAVVDVWDALLSDRPYRKGWPPEKVYAFIQEQAGKHFDPKVVDVFLKLWTPDMGHTVPTELPLEILEAMAKR